MAAVAGVDIFQSPYTPRDLWLMQREVETYQWDRTCRIIEYLAQLEKPLRFNEVHPYRKTGPRPKGKGVKIMKASEVKAQLDGGSHVDNSRNRNGRIAPKQ